MVSALIYCDLCSINFYIVLLQGLIRLVAKIFPDFQFLWLAEETKKNLPLELDFVHEAKNCERVAKMLQQFEFLKVISFYSE